MIISGVEVIFGDKSFTHSDLCTEIGEEVAEKIKAKSGFANRFITSPDTDILEIGRSATKSGFIHEKLNEADFIIVVCEYVQGLIPPPSSRLLSDRISDRQFVFDLNRGCSGFCEALVIANSLFAEGSSRKAVIITAENYSKIISRQNRTLSPIFSDAISFTFVEHKMGDQFSSNFGFDHTRNQDLEYKVDTDELYMNGAGVLSFVKSKVVPKIKELVEEKASNKPVDHFFAHQGSDLVIQSLNQQLINNGLCAEFLSGDIGNINASSIPFCIKSTFENGKCAPLGNCLLSGFGVGLSFCNVLMDIRYQNDNR